MTWDYKETLSQNKNSKINNEQKTKLPGGLKSFFSVVMPPQSWAYLNVFHILAFYGWGWGMWIFIHRIEWTDGRISFSNFPIWVSFTLFILGPVSWVSSSERSFCLSFTLLQAICSCSWLDSPHKKLAREKQGNKHQNLLMFQFFFCPVVLGRRGLFPFLEKGIQYQKGREKKKQPGMSHYILNIWRIWRNPLSQSTDQIFLVFRCFFSNVKSWLNPPLGQRQEMKEETLVLKTSKCVLQILTFSLY